MSYYELGQKYFDEQEYIRAFEFFHKAIDDNTTPNDEISEAYNLMGAIILFDTQIEGVDESGLYYFLKALYYNPNNIAALSNIVESFGTSINSHQDCEAYDHALEKLQKLNHKFSFSEKRRLVKKRILRKVLCEDVR